jgi:hypothetical protein
MSRDCSPVYITFAYEKTAGGAKVACPGCNYISSPDQEVLIIPNTSLSEMKTILILLSLLAAVSLAAAYTPEQQNTVDGLKLSFQVGQAYERATQGQDVPAFNALVDRWNAWVMSNFGNDTSLLMQKMTVPLDLQKPYLAAGNNTPASTLGHQMDSTAQYTSNDVNLMSDAAIAKYAASEQGRREGADFLGGV